MTDLEAPLRRFEEALSELVQSDVLFIRLIHQDLVTAGGKRIRPRLVFLASRALGGAPFELELALAVELLHSATLLHDDVVDASDLRRGQADARRVIHGLEHVGDMPMPIGGGGTMHRVQCGDSLLKLVAFDETPPAAAPGGISADELRQFAYLAGYSSLVKSLDITEVDATADAPDGRTVRLSALVLLEAAAGLASR